MRFLPARFVALLTLCGCLGGATGPAGVRLSDRTGRPVLFVGNSLTYYNDLPLMVEALADSVPGLTADERLNTATSAYPDYALYDHWADGTSVRAIEQRTWSVVVLQQGPSALDESRVLLRDYAKRFDEKVRGAGGRSALYAVWPSSSRQFDFDRVNESYTLAASDVNGMLFPVGEAWRAAWRRDPTLALYSSDGLHPTVRGTYLGALVIASMLVDRSPVGMPARFAMRSGAVVTVPPAEAMLLQEAAAEAIATFGRR